MGAGDSRQRSDLLAGLPLISKTKRECPVGTPSFVLSGGIAAWGKGLPSVSRLRAGRVPPAPCGLRAATPARPGRLGRRPPRPPAAVGDMWRLVAAFGGSGRAPAGLASRQPLRGGTPPQSKAKPLRGAPAARPCFAPPPRRSRRRCSGAARPPLCGGCGAVRASGPCVPGSGQPPRAGPPAALPALVRLCLR